MQTDITSQALKRRSFAIISHPDAGKTTLTEKLLLYGGAIHLAGSVKARKSQRSATSDWMEMERERGISISSTVLQFEYGGFVLNLLDTPGHNDFSADTYRTLTAADCVVMLIDNAKGVEQQTEKLFKVCRDRGIPIFTFINKLDYVGREPLALLAEVEDLLGIRSVPVNWPIGQGSDFRGVYDRASQMVHLFKRVAHGASKVDRQAVSIEDPHLEEMIGAKALADLKHDIELLDVAGERLDLDAILGGELTPVYFGSALTNFGVELFLRSFLEIAPAPAPRMAEGREVALDAPFSGFIFKIQANMDRQHRDRIAFLRVVSGKFEKDMLVLNPRVGKSVRLARPQRLFAQERETVEEAYPGDIIGLSNPGAFRLGDTLTAGAPLQFREVPDFPPETFARLNNQDVGRFKHFEKGIAQLCEEGLVTLLFDTKSRRREPVLGAVGKLQFDVVQHRLQSEYGVRTSLSGLPYDLVFRTSSPAAVLDAVYWGEGAKVMEDAEGKPVILVAGEWTAKRLVNMNPALTLLPWTQREGVAPAA